jgi:hypothetical protein
VYELEKPTAHVRATDLSQTRLITSVRTTIYPSWSILCPAIITLAEERTQRFKIEISSFCYLVAFVAGLGQVDFEICERRGDECQEQESQSRNFHFGL